MPAVEGYNAPDTNTVDDPDSCWVVWDWHYVHCLPGQVGEVEKYEMSDTKRVVVQITVVVYGLTVGLSNGSAPSPEPVQRKSSSR